MPINLKQRVKATLPSGQVLCADIAEGPYGVVTNWCGPDVAKVELMLRGSD